MRVPAGFQFASINCGLRKERKDLGLIYCEKPAACIGFFTSNANTAYSVDYCKKNIKNPIKAVLVNSGNANCFSHSQGLRDTTALMKKLATKLKVSEKSLLFASTGIIGIKMPFDKVTGGFDSLLSGLSNDYMGFAKSIITTDKYEKVSYADAGKNASILGIAKGAGMICPKMATMLAFVMTDAWIEDHKFKTICREAMEESFNSISVDGCMSTNDTLFILSSKKVILKSSVEIAKFTQGIKQVCLDLAKMMVADGEGASKLIEIKIKNAKSREEARLGALAIANSNLFKCAVYGQDANWGRIIGALGHAGIALTQDAKIMASDLTKKEVTITVDLKRGKSNWRFFTCDLTPEYIKINADYN